MQSALDSCLASRRGIWSGVWWACVLAAAIGCRPIPPTQDPFVTSERGEAGLPVLGMRWKHPVADRLREHKPQEFASATLYGAQLFVGSANGTLYALSTEDGSVLWSVPLRAVNTRPVVDARGRIYIGTVDGAMVALQASDGAEIWRYATRGPILAPPVLVDGQVIFSNEADQVYALDSDTGKFLWQYKGETPEAYTLRGHAGVAVSNGLVFTGFSSGVLVALRQSTGSVAWMTSLKGEGERFVDVDGTPVVGHGTVFATSSSGGLFALDETTGLIRWRLSVEGANGLALDGNRLYLAAADQGIFAVDLEGHVVWRQGTHGGGEPAPPVVSGEYLLYTLSADGMFIADKRTGQVHQFFDPGDGISAPPTVDGDRLYVLSNRGILYAMHMNRF